MAILKSSNRWNVERLSKCLRKLEFARELGLACRLLRLWSGRIEARLKEVPPHPFSTSGESPLEDPRPGTLLGSRAAFFLWH
jgi:hypothetical protein